MKVAIVTPAIHNPERLFGAERLFAGLVAAFQTKAQTDWIQVPTGERRWEGILQGYLHCYDLDLSAYDLVISTKNPTFAVQHPNHICWLVHQVRVFYDRFDDEFGPLPKSAFEARQNDRAVIHRLDTLSFQRVRKIFSIGHEPAVRLKRYNGFDAEVLYPPAFTQGHYSGAQEYFFLPGRLHRWKRVDLVIRALEHLPGELPLLIAGTGEDEAHLRDLAQGDSRIRFLGFVSDREMLKLYANALAVLFPTREEDFGYVAIEAMLSHKPVIVCRDSGEPTRLVQNGRSGFVVDPNPVEIAAAIVKSSRLLPCLRKPHWNWNSERSLMKGTTAFGAASRTGRPRMAGQSQLDRVQAAAARLHLHDIDRRKSSSAWPSTRLVLRDLPARLAWMAARYSSNSLPVTLSIRCSPSKASRA